MGLLQLGTFLFDIDDLPDQLPLGGEQMISVYKFPGGVKDIQTFGAFDDTITFTGTFNYTAESKVSQIDKMYRSGALYTLKVGSFKSLSVVITKFKTVYRSPIAIDYSLDLEVLKSGFTTTNTSTNTLSSGSSNNSTSNVVTSAPVSNAPAPQRVYTAIKGDTLWKISKDFYNTGTLFGKIMTANNLKSSTITAGQKLVIP